ncbi:HD domain protein [Sulfuriferula multivorans]|uniref:HD domain protein n=1 Tax=Sulfuriferula multivorans TaxID=1559896 RepID=A0A401JHM4_9PROT|nr:HDOD domain-containing protein [Sulfuriferula multivorans]GBL47485.1 HD domain protein [Sulfuriferula multivorans]
MNKLSMDETVKTIRSLPPLPEIVTDLLSSMGKENIDIDTLAEKLTRDQALVATTLRLANSSFYGMSHRVTGIREAFAILGLKSMRTLITAASVTNGFIGGQNLAGEIEKNWRHSIAVAVCAKTLARQLNQDQELAFTVGLLHDIGRLVLAIYFPEQHQAVLTHRTTHDCTAFQAEQAVLGIDHAMVGQALVEYWKLPPEIQLAIGSHHTPDQSKQNALVSFVHVADAIVHALDLALDEEELVPLISTAAWNKLGIGQETVLLVFEETEQQFEEMCQILIV